MKSQHGAPSRCTTQALNVHSAPVRPSPKQPKSLISGPSTVALASLALLLFASPALRAQGSDPAALNVVKSAVNTELKEARLDRSNWEYRDHDVQPDKNSIYEVIETPHGELKRLLVLNGNPLTGSAEQQELERIRHFVNSPSQQAHARKDDAHDDAQARELLKMLPHAFLWSISTQNANEVTLQFRPDPSFHAPDMQSRVLGVMAGEMVVTRPDNRIKTLRGKLTHEIKIGWGLLGKLDKGGTFDVERRPVTPGHWEITETHVHIGGHALLFKTIGQQDDDTKTDWKPSTASNLRVAEQQLTHQQLTHGGAG